MREKNAVPAWAYFALALAIIGVVIYAAGTVTPASSSRPMLNTPNNPTATPTTPSATITPITPNYPPLPPEATEGIETQNEFVFPNTPEPDGPPTLP